MPPTKIFVGSLPPGTKPEELRHLFEDYGIVVECDVMNRCGFVHMETQTMAETAITALNRTEFKGQMIVVEAGRPKDKKGSGIVGGVMVGRGSIVGGRGSRGGPGFRGSSSGFVPRGGMGHTGRGNFGGYDSGGGMGPIRRNDDFKPQRSAPYSTHQRGRFNQYGSNQRDHPGYANADDSNFGGNNSYGGSQYHNESWKDSSKRGGGSGSYSTRSYNSDTSGNYANGFGASMNGNSFSGGYGSSKGGSSAQDRRGFALTGGSQQQHESQHQQYGSDGGDRYSGRAAGGGNDRGGGMYMRRNNGPNVDGDGGERVGVRGGFGGGRGRGRGSQSYTGGYKRGLGESVPAANNYQKEFPPLGAGGGRGGMQRNASRQNMMSNRRF